MKVSFHAAACEIEKTVRKENGVEKMTSENESEDGAEEYSKEQGSLKVKRSIAIQVRNFA